MEHKFKPSLVNFTICQECKLTPIQHTDAAICDACPNVGPVELYAGMALCIACIQKEKDHQSPDKQELRLREAREREVSAQPVLSLGGVIDHARKVDYAIQVRTDIFNAETVAIQAIRDAVNQDPTIPADKKHFRLTELVNERFIHLQKVIFEQRNTLVENENKQRVIQQELNVLANKLRADEREKLKIANPEYKPGVVKPVSERPKSLGAQKQKFNKKELIEVAAKLQEEGLPVQWNMLQMTCVSKNMTPAQAAEHLRKIMAVK